MPGSLWNRANVLPNSLVSLLGLPQEDPQLRHALAARPRPIKIASYETAGAYEWTAPDLCDGHPYKIGVLVIGGGGSGAVNAYAGGDDYSTSTSGYALGGGSGYSRHIIESVTPGDIRPLVVGAGGAPRTSLYGDGSGGNTSSFGGTTVYGGGAGTYENSSSNAFRSMGSRGNGCSESGAFGLERMNGFSSYSSSEAPWQCVNLFEQKEILGSGGCATVVEDTGEIVVFPGGKGPDGLGGGDAGATGGENGTAPGCGGGGTVNGYASGAGADGAVYIYFLGVANE